MRRLKTSFLVLLLFLLSGFVVGLRLINYPKNENASFQKDFPDGGTTGQESLNVTVIIGGDVMLGRNVRETALSLNNYSYTTERIREYTRASDIFFVNLENPVIEDCPNHFGGFTFCAPPKMLEGLSMAGANIVSLANNHSGNYGKSGLEETKLYLKDSLISFVGQDNFEIKEVNGIKFGFLGFDFTVKEMSNDNLLLIEDSNSKVDFLIIGVHWGEEYKDKANTNQRKWAREMVGHGADIVVGHHPHWVQDFECLNDRGNDTISTSLCDGVLGKPVYYSLGNLIFDQMWSEETKKGMLVKLVIEKRGITQEERVNTYIEKPGQPRIEEVVSNVVSK